MSCLQDGGHCWHCFPHRLGLPDTACIALQDNLILDILPELILESDSPERLVEISAGILGNMACHTTLHRRLSEHPQLQQSVIQGALLRDDAGCICEACRVLSAVLAGSHADSWLKDGKHRGHCLSSSMAPGSNPELRCLDKVGHARA